MRSSQSSVCALSLVVLMNYATTSAALGQDARARDAGFGAARSSEAPAGDHKLALNDRRPEMSNPDMQAPSNIPPSVQTQAPDQLHTLPDPISYLQSEVNSLEADVKTLKARLADDEYKLAHHHHTFLGAHYVQITAHTVRDLLEGPDNPTIAWPTAQSWNITEEPTFDPLK